MAYNVIAQYHDVFESISLIRQQFRKTLDSVSVQYRRSTEREIRIDSDMSLSRSSLSEQQLQQNRVNEIKDKFDPVTINNTVTPPSHSDFHINVNIPNNKNILGGCISFLFWLGFWSVVSMSILSFLFCYYENNLDICVEWALVARIWVGDLFRELGEYFVELGEVIRRS